ncbi:MAG: hypothetical protein MJ168_05430 [Clostridia bacterium]|nr:hypothetical protein [Clostridia bacterium]
MKFNHVVLNMPNINGIEKKIQSALLKTADAVKTDVQQSGTMPFDTGALQNRSTFIDSSKVSDYSVAVVSDTPYARRLYFHPEYNFRQDKNPNAGGEWFEPYISGAKKDYAQKVFARFMKGG